MDKRMFRREGTALIDEYQDELGQRRKIYFPRAALDEADIVDDSAREEALREIATGASDMSVDFRAFENEPPAMLLKILLQGIAAGSPRAPLMLLRFVDDPRVRPALSSAARAISADYLTNFVPALGLAGGHDACDVLRERLQELLTDPQIFLPNPFSIHRALGLASTAGALLRLDPQALDAARALLRLFEHPRAINRRSAVREAREVFRSELQTDAMRELRAGLDKLLDTSDLPLFVTAAPALAAEHFTVVHRRCMEILEGPDHELRLDAAVALTRVPTPHTAMALASLVRWVPHGAPLTLALHVAGLVAPFVDEAVARDLARRGLAADSPMLRYEAMLSVAGLGGRVARSLIEEALLDEPDPALQRKFREMLATLNDEPSR
jgi:hypothetical protein